MSTTEAPTLALPQRLWLALDHKRVSVKDMAGYLGVSEGTVRNYLKGPNRGGTVPNRATIIAWATRCEVPLDWLEQGIGESGWLHRTPVAA